MFVAMVMCVQIVTAELVFVFVCRKATEKAKSKQKKSECFKLKKNMVLSVNMILYMHNIIGMLLLVRFEVHV